MSIHLWNSNVPGPSSPLVSIVLRNRVRGSPKLARIGCCLPNGLIGQGKAEALLLESSKTPSEQRMARERRGTATWDVLVAGEVSPSIGCGSLEQSRADASANGRRPSSSSRPSHVAPEVVQQRTDVLRRCLPGESERTGREHLCPTPLVEAHLGAQIADHVRDCRDHLRPSWRCLPDLVDLDASPPESRSVLETGAREEPRCDLGVDDDPWLLVLPAVVGAILGAHQLLFRVAQRSESRRAPQEIAVLDGVPVEVVGRQVREVATSTPVSTHYLIFPGRDVL